jgi:hypothetical protein
MTDVREQGVEEISQPASGSAESVIFAIANLCNENQTSSQNVACSIVL